MSSAMKPAPLLLLSGLALLGAGCVVGTVLSAEKAAPAGSVDLRSPSLGDRTLKPTECQSGEPQLFLGADFLDGQGITTRLILEPTGRASLRFFQAAHPLDPGILFQRQDCGLFKLSLDRNGWRINDVYDLLISLDFECHAASGESATGHLVADHCH
jgi:hypothetical protein